VVRALLGHASLASTTVYLHAGDEDKRAAKRLFERLARVCDAAAATAWRSALTRSTCITALNSGPMFIVSGLPALSPREYAGVTSRYLRSGLGSSRAKAASTARPAQSSLDLGCWRRNTATSWRSTSSSASFDADERPSIAIHPATRLKDEPMIRIMATAMVISAMRIKELSR
jgi:hypothetical protein